MPYLARLQVNKMKIVFFGDSITEGVFELLSKDGGGFESVFDKEHCYHKILGDKLKQNFPNIEFDIINAGVAGNSSLDGLNRINEVIDLHPDLVVVCFGLNDAYMRDVDAYGNNINAIFKKITQAKAKCVFMTPNMMNTYLANGTLPVLYQTAKDCAECQNQGVLDNLLAKGKEYAVENGVFIADAYSFWKKLAFYGIDTTALLSNKINHPTREMHRLFADILYDTFIKNNLIL